MRLPAAFVAEDPCFKAQRLIAMSDTRILLISCDPSLVHTVREVVECVQGCRLEVTRTHAGLETTLQRPTTSLILYHVSEALHQEQSDALERLNEVHGDLPALVVLADRYVADQARRFLQLGAIDYLSRPIDLTRLTYLVDILTVKSRYRLATPDVQPATASVGQLPAEAFLCRSESMDALMDQVRKVAGTDTTLLLSGETGTGKTRLARVIHELSPRAQEPFVVVNCGALSESLIESEIFGHVRGAFTGADRDRVGKFEHAERGTLLLDEIDALSPSLQAKLLRAVEDRVFEPVGSNRSVRLVARLITASNRWLDEEVHAGRFRRDLYYRLNVVEFRLPPLRERRSAIGDLAGHFARSACFRQGQEPMGIRHTALEALRAYDWPGNLRELRNAMERAVALCDGKEIQREDLPELIQQGASAIDASGNCAPATDRLTSKLGRAKSQTELAHIAEALTKHENNRSRAAAELGISRVTLYKKLRKYGLIGSS